MTDFLRELYHHVKAIIMSGGGSRLSAWDEMAVEFHFTLPDLIRTAEPAAVESAMNAFKDILWNAGFCNGARHLAVLATTETEAVATAVISEEAKDDPSGLVIKVSESNIALAERCHPDDPRLVSITTSATTTLNDAFAAEIHERASRYAEVVVVETSRDARRTSTDQVARALGPKGRRSLMRFNDDRKHPGSGYSGAGPQGLIYRRNAWGSAGRLHLSFTGNTLPRLFIRLRDPSGTLDVEDAWNTRGCVGTGAGATCRSGCRRRGASGPDG